MVKVIIINSCGECPHTHRVPGNIRLGIKLWVYCGIDNERRSINTSKIPSWCPLPDISSVVPKS